MSELPATIDRADQLAACCDRVRRAGRFAFDSEFIRDNTYDSVLCLVQIAEPGGRVSLVDPTGGLDVRPFWELVADPDVLTIVHAGKEDFELCLRQFGSPPRNVFDVQVAAGFVGLGYPLSLSRLVQALLDHRIAKAQTLTDWLRRPLSDAQVRYAVEDVQYLSSMQERLDGMLSQRGRGDWAAEEFARFEDPEHYRAPADERASRLRGAARLDARGLAALERLVELRDRWAQRQNRPARTVIRDDVLVEIARRRCETAEDLRLLRGFHQARNERLVTDVLETVRQALQTPRDQLPEPVIPREDAPRVRAVLDLLNAFVRAVCDDEGVAAELVGAASRLRELLDFATGATEHRPAVLRGWRERFVGQRLLDLLAGRSVLNVKGLPDALRIEIRPREGESGQAESPAPQSGRAKRKRRDRAD